MEPGTKPRRSLPRSTGAYPLASSSRPSKAPKAKVRPLSLVQKYHGEQPAHRPRTPKPTIASLAKVRSPAPQVPQPLFKVTAVRQQAFPTSPSNSSIAGKSSAAAPPTKKADSERAERKPRPAPTQAKENPGNRTRARLPARLLTVPKTVIARRGSIGRRPSVSRRRSNSIRAAVTNAKQAAASSPSPPAQRVRTSSSKSLIPKLSKSSLSPSKPSRSRTEAVKAQSVADETKVEKQVIPSVHVEKVAVAAPAVEENQAAFEGPGSMLEHEQAPTRDVHSSADEAEQGSMDEEASSAPQDELPIAENVMPAPPPLENLLSPETPHDTEQQTHPPKTINEETARTTPSPGPSSPILKSPTESAFPPSTSASSMQDDNEGGLVASPSSSLMSAAYMDALAMRTRGRKIFVPPLEEDRQASKNAQIVQELARLRSARRVQRAVSVGESDNTR
ncbi:hypothetical protein CYLTODRAFT_426502 [Cylindrobasidium torrendii FP15055 ss-10]|uniref:Uncharacterized protein n=1 Tax=Cylindrobasidium torrendii FP15055 ss-10 TaxID=1314674 RepID=A0A0D7AX66_9AGAR|nr:hypothetical protein CYLTODRAFT_426502 [Cylindrobasidium torrendii FP15055 ss-10]